MESLAELADKELLALAGLLRLLVPLDGMVSALELAAIDSLGAGIGRERLDELILRAGRELPDTADVKRIVAEIKRPDARELIYGALFEVAANDSIVHLESVLLDWLRELWHLKPDAGPRRA